MRHLWQAKLLDYLLLQKSQLSFNVDQINCVLNSHEFLLSVAVQPKQLFQPCLIPNQQLIDIVCVQLVLSKVLRYRLFQVGENIIIQKFLHCINTVIEYSWFFILGICDSYNDFKEFVTNKITITLLPLYVLVHVCCNVYSINSCQVTMFSVRNFTLVTHYCKIIPRYYGIIRMQYLAQENILYLHVMFL